MTDPQEPVVPRKFVRWGDCKCILTQYCDGQCNAIYRDRTPEERAEWLARKSRALATPAPQQRPGREHMPAFSHFLETTTTTMQKDAIYAYAKRYAESAIAALGSSMPSGEALTDADLARIAYKGYDDYWTEDCKGRDLEAWAASAKAVIAALATQPTADQIIARFLESTGQYVTNDASREAAIEKAVRAALSANAGSQPAGECFNNGTVCARCGHPEVVESGLMEALTLAREYVKAASQRGYDGTNGQGIRDEANRRLAIIDAALSANAGSQQSEPDWYYAECADPDYSRLYHHKSDALTQVDEHGGTVTALYIGPMPLATPKEVKRTSCYRCGKRTRPGDVHTCSPALATTKEATALICPHGIHYDNACGACVPPRGTK